MGPAEDDHVVGQRDRSQPLFQACRRIIHPLDKNGDHRSRKQDGAQNDQSGRERDLDDALVIVRVLGNHDMLERPPDGITN